MICNLLRALLCISLVSLLLGVEDEAKAQGPTRFTVAVDDARHFIMYDQPAVFDAQVQAFLK